MTILAFDTCFGACSAALWSPREGFLLAERIEMMDRGHSERIVPMIQEVLAEAGLTLADVASFAVTIGPGSFTGVRTGLAVARALALATAAKIRGTTSLHVLAAGLSDTTGVLPRAIAVATRDGLVYFQTFDAEASPRTEARLASLQTAAELVGAERHLIAGSGAALVAAAAEGLVHDVCSNAIEVRADVLARLAANLPVLAPPVPLYLREPDAKPQTGYAPGHPMPRL